MLKIVFNQALVNIGCMRPNACLVVDAKKSDTRFSHDGQTCASSTLILA